MIKGHHHQSFKAAISLWDLYSYGPPQPTFFHISIPNYSKFQNLSTNPPQKLNGLLQ